MRSSLGKVFMRWMYSISPPSPAAGARCAREWPLGTAARTASRSRRSGCLGDRARWPPSGVRDARQGALEHQPVEARENADDLVPLTLDQVRRRPTVPNNFLSWFRLRRGRETVSVGLS